MKYDTLKYFWNEDVAIIINQRLQNSLVQELLVRVLSLNIRSILKFIIRYTPINETTLRINNVILSKVGRTGKGNKLTEAEAETAGTLRFIKISIVKTLQ